MTLTCEELADLILDFVGGDLDEAQRASFEYHLCGCRNCNVSVELYRATVYVCRALPKCDGGLPPGLEAKLRAAMEQSS